MDQNMNFHSVGFLMVVLFMSILFVSPKAHSAQAIVASITQGESGLDTSDEVLVLPFGSFQSQPLRVQAGLNLGDLVSCNVKNVFIVVRCSREAGGVGAEFTFSSPFRVAFIPADGAAACAVNLQGGTADVLTNEPTEIHSGDGEVVLGSKRTQYRFSILPSGKKIVRDAFVFEGLVSISSSRSSPTRLKAGSKIRLAKGAKRVMPEPLQARDINRSARVYAAVDISKTRYIGRKQQETYRRLIRQHEQVLAQPGLAKPRIDLALLRTNNQIKSPSTIQYLNQAAKLTVNDTKEQANISFLKGVTYLQLGKKVEAEQSIKETVRIDPGFTKDQFKKVYTIDQKTIKDIKLHKVAPVTDRPAAPTGIRVYPVQ